MCHINRNKTMYHMRCIYKRCQLIIFRSILIILCGLTLNGPSRATERDDTSRISCRIVRHIGEYYKRNALSFSEQNEEPLANIVSQYFDFAFHPVGKDDVQFTFKSIIDLFCLGESVDVHYYASSGTNNCILRSRFEPVYHPATIRLIST